MRKNQLHNLITAALFAALTCVATLVIQIPTPTQGYLNLGDCIVLAAGWTLGPVYGTAAAAVGSMMADVVTGYVHFAPATFVIKGAVALAAYFLLCFLKKFLKRLPALLLSGILAECIMICGYFCFEVVVLQYGFAATAGLVSNALQAAMGVAAGTALAGLRIAKK